jgi:hypothetical protein
VVHDGGLFLMDDPERDVSQGGVGDCYYMASLAAIAKTHPEKIRGMIRQNKDGTFSATFYRHRWPWELWKPEFERVVVRVNGEFLMQQYTATQFRDDMDLVYAQFGRRSRGLHEIWPMVAEKAYASFHSGSYDKIDGGFPGAALAEISGHPTKTHAASSVSLDSLAHWAAAKRAIVVSTKNELPFSRLVSRIDPIWKEPLYKNRRLQTGHTYWVESVDKKRRTVTLVNPAGWEGEHVTLTEGEFRRAMDNVYVNPVN